MSPPAGCIERHPGKERHAGDNEGVMVVSLLRKTFNFLSLVLKCIC